MSAPPVGPVQSLQIGVVGDQLGVAPADLAPFRGPGAALIGLQPSLHQDHEHQERGELHEGPGDTAPGDLVFQRRGLPGQAMTVANVAATAESPNARQDERSWTTCRTSGRESLGKSAPNGTTRYRRSNVVQPKTTPQKTTSPALLSFLISLLIPRFPTQLHRDLLWHRTGISANTRSQRLHSLIA